MKIGAVPRQGTLGQDDDDEIVTGIVLMRKGENPSEVLTAVKERVEALNETILPKGVKIVPFYDRTHLIDTTLHTVFKNLLEGALLVTVVLYLFLGNLRAAAIVAVDHPAVAAGHVHRPAHPRDSRPTCFRSARWTSASSSTARSSCSRTSSGT